MSSERENRLVTCEGKYLVTSSACMSGSQPISLQLCGYVKVGTKQDGKHFMSVYQPVW